MELFGWRFTNEPKAELKKLQADVGKLKLDLAIANKAGYSVGKAPNRVTALVHLYKIKHYADIAFNASGIRKPEIEAIIEARVQAVENLGIEVKDIDELIKELENGG